LRLEMTATRSDTATLGWLAESPPPTTILVGERTLLAPRAARRRASARARARGDDGHGFRRRAHDSDYAPGGRRRRRSTRNGCTKPKPRSTHMSRILAVRASIEGLWT
jgi:hypothetical protein